MHVEPSGILLLYMPPHTDALFVICVALTSSSGGADEMDKNSQSHLQYSILYRTVQNCQFASMIDINLERDINKYVDIHFIIY